MRIHLLNVSALAVSAVLLASPLQSSFSAEGVSSQAQEDRMALLEKRLAELEMRLAESEQDTREVEQRLAETEQETKQVKVLASSAAVTGGKQSAVLGNAATFDILANSAWRNLRWTHEEQWEGIRRGLTEEEVIEILGYPPRSVDSLKPRVDKVYWYETSLRDLTNGVRGKISFKKGKVVSIVKPDFSKLDGFNQEAAETRSRRLP